MLIRWPVLRPRKRGSASLTPNRTPLTLMSIWRWVVRSSSSRNDPSCMIPALLMTTSSGPSCSSTPSRNAATDSRRVTSSSKAAAFAPSSDTVAWAAERSMSPMPTFMPWRSRAVAVALPIPRAPPVIAATRPVRILASLAMPSTYRAEGAGLSSVAGDGGDVAGLGLLAFVDDLALDGRGAGGVAVAPGVAVRRRRAGVVAVAPGVAVRRTAPLATTAGLALGGLVGRALARAARGGVARAAAGGGAVALVAAGVALGRRAVAVGVAPGIALGRRALAVAA